MILLLYLSKIMLKYKKVEINKMMTKLDKLSDESSRLYNICKKEGCENIVSPSIWLLNQDSMREKWAEYHVMLDNVPEGTRKLLVESCLAQYMQFMYENYPAGFGKKLFEYCEKEEVISNQGKNNLKRRSAEIYLELSDGK